MISIVGILIGASLVFGAYQLVPTREETLIKSKDSIQSELSLMEIEFENQETRILEKQKELYTATCDLAREHYALKKEVSMAINMTCGGF